MNFALVQETNELVELTNERTEKILKRRVETNKKIKMKDGCPDIAYDHYLNFVFCKRTIKGFIGTEIRKKMTKKKKKIDV